MDMDSKSNLSRLRTNELNQNNGFTLRRNSNAVVRGSRKFSEDNILITAPQTENFRLSSFMDLADMEMLAKKLKKN